MNRRDTAHDDAWRAAEAARIRVAVRPESRALRSAVDRMAWREAMQAKEWAMWGTHDWHCRGTPRTSDAGPRPLGPR